jgi:hypothetical protein
VSVLDELRRAQEQVVARLQELEPLVSEYQELRQEADRLGLPVTAGQGSPPQVDEAPSPTTADAAPAEADATGADATPADATPARRPGGRRRSKGQGGRAPKRQPGGSRGGGSRGGGREAQLLELIAAQPGITVTAAGKQLGVDPTGLYRPVRKLVADGKVDKQGPALHLAG